MNKLVCTYILIIGLIVFNSCNSKKSNYDLLQGTWVSTDDAKYELNIEGHNWIDSYEGEQKSAVMFVQSTECTENKNATNNPDGQFLVTFSDDDVYCYYIVTLDDKNLELQFQGRGPAMVFTKK